jgi:putative transposase
LKRQAELLDISRPGLYYRPAGVSAMDKKIMDLIDEIYTTHPYYGNRRIRAELNLTHQIAIGRDHTRTLMKQLGLQAIYPHKASLSQPNVEHKIYPYLLRGAQIIKPNQIWSADITYVRLVEGWAYLVAIIDWFSRYVISWKLSNSLEIAFCLDCLNEALETNGYQPEIFNTDQGSHFTSPKFTNILENKNIRISMDGRGRCLDNIFVERLWRSVKQENIYLNSYQDVRETNTGLSKYFPFYNRERRHQSLNYRTPAEVYFN